MSSMFGHKWTSSYGDESDPDRVWYAVLKDTTWDQMKNGMDTLSKSGREWPPSAPEFLKLCLGLEDGVNVARVPSADATRERLEAIEHKISPSAKEKGWEMIREAQRGLK